MKGRLLRFSLCLCVLTLSACLDSPNLHGDRDEEIDEENVEYRTITVSITSDRDGVLCQVYSEYPFDELGNLVITPCLKAYTPVNTYLQIPATVKKLYVLVGTKTIYESGADKVDLHLE